MLKVVRRLGGGIVLMTLLATLFVSPVTAATPSYSLFGTAALVHPGNASATAVQASQGSVDPFYGGVDFSVPGVTTLSTITNLSTDLKNTAGGCGTGSPDSASPHNHPVVVPQSIFTSISTPALRVYG